MKLLVGIMVAFSAGTARAFLSRGAMKQQGCCRSSTFRMTATFQRVPQRNIDLTIVDPVVRTSPDTTTLSEPPLYRFGDQKTDDGGLPLVYEPDIIQSYWDSRPREMADRWTFFLSLTVPFLTKVGRDFTAGRLLMREYEIARDLRIMIEKLGPTFIKLGQALSIRPDVIGPAATEELAKLQDAVAPFPHEEAMVCLELELGCPVDDVFSAIGDAPVAAASLAQVYRATLRATGEEVAVKIQRPGLLPVVTRDLYVMRKAVGVYQGLSDRWTKQTTDFNELLRVWADGFYKELDFLNEAQNQRRMRDALAGCPGVYVPRVVGKWSTRRLLVTEWIDGVKLTQCSPPEVRELTAVAQEAFLRQLLEVGFIHADPHPGNLIRMSDTSKGRVALIDFGLVAELEREDQDAMVSALIHTANADFPALIDDLVGLRVLPADTDRVAVEPLMKRVIGPYVFQGGGAKNMNVQSLAKDLGRATLEIPFNIPPYFALVARALGILEGIALTGDPDYRIVLEAYPFVTRRVVSEGDRPVLQRALRDLLFARGSDRVSARRLQNLLAYAVGGASAAAGSDAGAAVFVDFDAEGVDGGGVVNGTQTLAFLLSERARPLRTALEAELADAADLVLRKVTRQNLQVLRDVFRPPPPPFPFLPRLPTPQLPFLPPPAVVDALAPRLSPQEEVQLASAYDLAATVLGVDATMLRRLTIARSPGELLFGDRGFGSGGFGSGGFGGGGGGGLLLDLSTLVGALTDPLAAKALQERFRGATEAAGLLRPGSPEAASAAKLGTAVAERLGTRARSRWEAYTGSGGSLLGGGSSDGGDWAGRR